MSNTNAMGTAAAPDGTTAAPAHAPAKTPRTINIAIMALGGQGGGVLVDWIVDLAEHAGWTAQATSVAGVAQRTGATIYYIEMVEPTPGREPVLALMAVPGDVDVLIAAELMEAGRAVERGLVTPERTTVIASSHRTYAVQEKITPGNGLADSAAVLDIVRKQARHAVLDDMQALAVRQGSVISASLFGALAGSGALPFSVAEFEAVVERSGIGVKPSLAALRAARTRRQCGAATAGRSHSRAVSACRLGLAGRRPGPRRRLAGCGLRHRIPGSCRAIAGRRPGRPRRPVGDRGGALDRRGDELRRRDPRG